MKECPECEGSGTMDCEECGTHDVLDCDECGGTGEVDD